MSDGVTALRRLLYTPQGAIGLVLFVVLILLASFGPTIAPKDPETFHFGARFAAPSAEFPLGTDWYGRDLLSRVLTGAQSTILLAILATAIGTVAGTLVGVVSGYLGGWADDAIMRLTDAVMAIPSLLFALMLLAVLGSSAENAVIAIGIAFTPGMARIARSVTLQVRSLDYIAVARRERRLDRDGRDPAQHRRAGDRRIDDPRRLRNHDAGDAVVSGPRRAAAFSRMGTDDGRGARPHVPIALADPGAGRGHRAGGDRIQPSGRWFARCTQPKDGEMSR